MAKWRRSIAAKLVIGYGVIGLGSILAVSATFYAGTVGVLDRNIDGRITSLAERMLQQDGPPTVASLAAEIERQLNDGIDNDREIFLLLDAGGNIRAGNLNIAPQWPAGPLMSASVVRDGRATRARLYRQVLDDGGVLVVGRDLSEQEAIRALFWRALATAAALSLALTAAGALWFRRQIVSRLGVIRLTAEQIEAGDMSRRVPVIGDDEFARLSADINRMLDRIALLMDGIRHVSNAIAHDLRTPLGRIRGRLDDALRHPLETGLLDSAARAALDDVDGLISLFERLLQIAEAEAGVQANLFDKVDLNDIAGDLAELYEASAEELGLSLGMALAPAPLAYGDRNLLASAVASLLDNAIKYGGHGASIVLRTARAGSTVSIAVCDNGPGIPGAERSKVVARFYRLDASRHLPGNGLGLSIVDATAKLHGGSLELSDASPGLIARIVLPGCPAA